MSIPASIGLLAVRRISTLVGGPGSPAPAYRSDMTEFTADRLPAYNVFREDDEFAYKGARDSAECNFVVIVRCMVKAVSECDEAVDPLMVFAWQAIMADTSLGALVSDVKITKAPYSYLPKGEYDQLAVDLRVEVSVDVSRSDPSVNMTFLS
jgi:hypothetical protein